MTELVFRTDLGLDARQEADLPIEIRRLDLSLVHRTVASGSVSVEPGDYVISAHLPSGLELLQQVTTTKDEPKLEVHLSALGIDAFDLSKIIAPVKSVGRATARRPAGAQVQIKSRGQKRAVPGGGVEERFQFTARELAGVEHVVDDGAAGLEFARIMAVPAMPFHVPQYLAQVASPPEPAEAPTISAVAGNIFRKRSVKPLEQPLEITDYHGVPSVESAVPTVAPVFVTVEWSDKRIVNIAVPRFGRSSFHLIFPAPGEIVVHIENPNADALLAYLRAGELRQARTLGQSRALTAEGLLESKLKDPIAAAVGAYALLRLGELDRLHNWTKNLFDWFPSLPDGAAIRGEHLARQGDQRGALAALLKLRARGLPLFSDGVSYALSRLRVLSESAPTRHQNSIKALLKDLQRYAGFIDFAESITRFAGKDALNPGTGVVSQ